jgi:mitochondrial fission protein ELM1
MTPPIAGLEALQPAHEAARTVLTSWQELRDSMRMFCEAPAADEKPMVLTRMDRVASAYERFQSELKLLRQSLKS